MRLWLASGFLVIVGCGSHKTVEGRPDRHCASDVMCAIMPLGDSITYGIASTDGGGYREPLLRLAVEASQSITFVGSNESGPLTVDGAEFPRHNEGHPGYTIDNTPDRSGLTLIVAEAITTQAPHIITLMIGTNDVSTSFDLDNAPSRLQQLIETIFTTAPDVILIVAKIIPTTSAQMNVDVAAFNEALPDIVDRRTLDGYSIALVDCIRPAGPIVELSPLSADPRCPPRRSPWPKMSAAARVSAQDFLLPSARAI